MNTTNILYAIVALGGMGVLLGALLGMADKLFAVQVDERVAARKRRYIQKFKKAEKKFKR